MSQTLVKMIPTLFIILTSLLCLQSQQFEDFVASGKCPLTKVETYILHMRFLNKSQIFLPRLKDLKSVYPGDRFTVSPEKDCVDETPVCAEAVSGGACVGQDRKVTQYMGGCEVRELTDCFSGQRVCSLSSSRNSTRKSTGLTLSMPTTPTHFRS